MVKSKKTVKTFGQNQKIASDSYLTINPKALGKLGGFRSNMPKFVQGVTYLDKNEKLYIVLKYKTEDEYDPITKVEDSSVNANTDIKYTPGTITLTYKKWRFKTSKDKTLDIIFGSGFSTKITIKVPGANSKFPSAIGDLTSVLTDSPHKNFLSVEFSDNVNSATILGAVYPKKDPYTVFNYKGTFSYNLPYAYYINSTDLNEILTEQGVTSSFEGVEEGISPRGVGSIYSGPVEQEIHFLNVLNNSKVVTNSGDLLSQIDQYAFSYGFIYSKNLYNIADHVVTYEVCKNKGESNYYLTTKQDCEGNTISDEHLDGERQARFIDGGCCDINCHGFSVTLEDLTPIGTDFDNNTGKIKATVTGGQSSYTFVRSGGSMESTLLASAASVSTIENNHTFTGIGWSGDNEPPFTVTVTDANGCSVEAHIRLNPKGRERMDFACKENDAINFDGHVSSTTIGVIDQNCFFCKDKGVRGEDYKALAVGSKIEYAQETGIDLVSLDSAQVTAAKYFGNGSGRLSIKGNIFPSAIPTIVNSTTVTYKVKLYDLGSGENANSITKKEILAISPTSTATVTSDFSKQFINLTGGKWYAVNFYIEDSSGDKNWEVCQSVHRIYIGYGGCTDPESTTYEPKADYHNQERCTYECSEVPLKINVKPTDQPCLKTVSIPHIDSKNEEITWKIGAETFSGPGPHFATEKEYVKVYRQNTKTKCTDSAETHIKSADCNLKESDVTTVVRSLWIMNAQGTGGCTDPSAPNYNCDAIWDDGSCQAVVPGCTDQVAYNYDKAANVDNGTCIYGIAGCINPNALNYNPMVTIPDAEACEWCPEFGSPGQEAISLNNQQSVNLASLTAAELNAGNTDITGKSSLTYTFFAYAMNEWGPIGIPANSTLKLYGPMPMDGKGTIQGYRLRELTFPLGDILTPAASTFISGLEAQHYGDSSFGTWQEDGSITNLPGNWMFGINPPLTEFEYPADPAGIGMGMYVIEFGFPYVNPETNEKITCYTRSFRSIPNAPGNQFVMMDLNNYGAGVTDPDSGWQADLVLSSRSGYGCPDPLADNYTGPSNWPKGFKYQALTALQQQPIWYNSSGFITNGITPDEAFIQVLDSTIDGNAVMSQCTYNLPSPPCLPTRLDAKLTYLFRCNTNSLGNWYNNMSTGKQDRCGEKGLWTNLFIEYLLNKKGLDCIYNCSDLSTPDYDPKTCEESWIEGGSKMFTVNASLQGNGTYTYGEFVKVDTLFPTWYGDTNMQGIFVVNQNCGSNCGNPLGTGWANWKPCIDPKKITESTNYIDKFFKFANEYCQSCSPCSFGANNSIILLDSTTEIGQVTTDGSGDNQLTIGGESIDWDV